MNKLENIEISNPFISTSWICYAISKTDPAYASKLAEEYVNDLRQNDFRIGGRSGAPYECFHPSGYSQNPVYMTTVTCHYIVFKSMISNISIRT